MRIAFYAPMKAPLDPRPSGDRLISRMLMGALHRAGHEVSVVSTFRSRDGTGEPRRQERLRVLGAALAARLVRRFSNAAPEHRPELWFTYHLYHKAPDWLGPGVSRALGIPYVVAEASYAPKQASGPWARGHAATGEAIAVADAVFSLNRNDDPCVRALLREPRRLVPMAPFLNGEHFDAAPARAAARAQVATRYGLPGDEPWLVCVAMMRPGNKRDSYAVLARALAQLPALPWRLLLVGDGSARAEIEADFAGFEPGRVVFTGLRDDAQVRTLLAACDVFAWPAVDEIIGMALLQAQAAGLAVVAGGAGAVPDLVEHGRTGLLTCPGDSSAFAAALASLLVDPSLTRELGDRARMRARERHHINGASATLDKVLGAIVGRRWP